MSEVALEPAPVLEAIGQLKTGGLILVGVLAVLALVAWFFWLRNKRQERQAEAAAAARENAMKEKRAERYTAALENLRVEIEGMRKDSNKGTQAIQAALSQQTNTLQKSLNDLEGGHGRRQVELSSLMKELLDRQKGVINFEDSIRIIELNFRLEVKPTVLAVIRDSIKNNHFYDDPGLVQEGFLDSVNKILFKAQESMQFYSLSTPAATFFPCDDAKHYVLAELLWKSIKTIHEVQENVADPAVMSRRTHQAQLRAENLMNSFVNTTISKLRGGGNSDEIVAAVSASVAVSDQPSRPGLRPADMTTPRPE